MNIVPNAPVIARVEIYGDDQFPWAGAMYYEVHAGSERDVVYSYDEAQRCAQRMRLEQSDPDPVMPILWYGDHDYNGRIDHLVVNGKEKP